MLPGSIVGFAGYLILTWLILLMFSSFIRGSLYVLLTLPVTLIGNIMSGYTTVKAGSAIAPTRASETARVLLLLFAIATIVGVITYWDNGSNTHPGIVYFVGDNGGLWRWWLLFCAFMSVMAGGLAAAQAE